LNLKRLERTGSKPFDLFFGRSFSSFSDFKDVTEFEDIETAIEERLEKLVELRDVIWPMIAVKTSQVRQNKAKWTNQHIKQVPSISPGTRVMAVDQTRASKWDPVYGGPYTVIRQTKGGAYVLQDHDGKELSRKMTIQMLKLADDRMPSEEGDEDRKKVEKVDKDKNEHFEVLGILDHRKMQGNKNEYRVRWKGYKKANDTWEPEENFDDLDVIKKYWNQKRRGNVELPKSRGRPKKKV
jgi:hypothetical protein